MTKLRVGSVILVHGFVMLKGLDDGFRYRVVNTTPYFGSFAYQFKKIGSRAKSVRHYASSVDAWIRDKDHPDLNRIEVDTE